MTSRRAKQASILLNKTQIDFLKNLAKRIEKESYKKMSPSKIMKVLTKSLTCIKVDIHEWRREKEIERELVNCVKKATRELKG